MFANSAIVVFGPLRVKCTFLVTVVQPVPRVVLAVNGAVSGGCVLKSQRINVRIRLVFSTVDYHI